MKEYILVTGGCGYIGSCCVHELIKKKYNVIVIDKKIRDFNSDVLYICGDIKNRKLLCDIFSRYSVSCVIHFASYIDVNESIKSPIKYYNNNILGTLSLLDCMVKKNVKKIIFSSSAAVYGMQEEIPISENLKLQPINAYGNTKLCIERMIIDYNKAYGINYVIFRYFNAAGADLKNNLGENHKPETHIIPLIINSEQFKLFGDTYKTPDGSCIRDYVHILDISGAHIKAIKYKNNDIFNIGSGVGYSNIDIIDKIKRLYKKKKYNILVCDKRAGDPDKLIADNKKMLNIFRYKLKYNIDDILKHAIKYHCSGIKNNGF